MSKAVACPPDYTLSELMQGKINEPELSQLSEHLESCGGCQEKARTLSPFDTFVEPLRGNPDAARKIAESIPQPLVEIVKSIARVKEPVGSDTVALTHDSVVSTENEINFLAPPQAPDEIGRLGSYRILSILGKGGMGVVFLADDPKLDRKVALKVMLPKIAANPAAKERFEREARAAARLKSDHIVHIYQVSEERGIPYLAMELLEGAPLDKFLEGGKKLTLAQILRIGRETAKGLAAAHEKGLIHRDIKPGNLWLESVVSGPWSVAKEGEAASATDNGPLTTDFRVKILDFGLARSEKDDVHLTQSGAIVGTPAYMAPEQARADKPVDARADLFSLGCVLYRLCAGDIPFKAETTMGVLLAIAMNEPPAVSKINDQIPSPLSELIMQLLEKDPAKRPASARVVIDRLTAIEKNLGGAANDTVHVSSTSQVTATRSGTALLPAHAQADTKSEIASISLPSKPRSNVGIWLALACVLLLLGGGAYGIYQLFFDTPHGRIVVQIEGDDVEARFKKGKLELYDKDGKLMYTLEPSERIKELKAGNYGIKVVGVDGLELDTDKFEMKRGGKVVVSVLLDRKALAKKDAEIKEVKHEPKTPATEYALRFEGKDRVEVPKFKLTSPGQQDFTIEAWFTPGPIGLESVFRIADFGNVNLRINRDGSSQLTMVRGKTQDFVQARWLKAGRKEHIAAQRKGDEIQIYLNGRLVEAKKITPGSRTHIEETAKFGAAEPNATAKGHLLGAVRISKVARYDKNFMPQKRFEPDKDTLALYHFDEGQGDVLKDSSGNGHHGKIVGAKWVHADGSPIAPAADYALKFDGETNHVLIPTLGRDDGGPITLEAHVIPAREKAEAGGAAQTIVHLGGRHAAYLDQFGHVWRAYAAGESEGATKSSESHSAKIGRRVHVAAVWDGKQMEVFINGKRSGKSDGNSGVARGLSRMTLGAAIGKKSQSPFAGVIDEVRISQTARYTKDFTPEKRFTPDKDTLALYHFDEGTGDVLKDSSGNNHHGKIVGARWVKADGTPIPPPDGYALEFDGVTNYVHIPTLVRTGAGAITMEAYVIPASLTSKERIWPHQRVFTLLGNWGLELFHSSEVWSCLVAPEYAKGVLAESKGKMVKVGERTHVAAVWDGKTARIFVNGRLSGQAEKSGAPLGGPHSGTFLGAFWLDKKTNRIQQPFAGVIDEVRVSRVARYDKDFTPAQRFEPDKDTLALYHFDEGTGDELKDSSGNNHHGKIVGAKWVKADGTPIAPPAGSGDYALRFKAGKGEQGISLPKITIDPKSPVTVEGYFIPAKMTVKGSAILVGRFNVGFNGREWHVQGATGPEVVLGKRVHIAGVYTATGAHLFVDGKLTSTLDKVTEESIAERNFHIGGNFDGVIDEVHISKSARYDKDFTPPVRHMPDKDTVVLYHFDEGTGDVLKDSSGNNHHGKIVGAKWVKADGTPMVVPCVPEFALDFAGKGAKVDFAPAKLRLPDSELTIEAFFTPREVENCQLVMADMMNLEIINGQLAWFVQEERGIRPIVAMPPGLLVKGKHVHVAGVKTAQELRLFVDGKLTEVAKAPASGWKRNDYLLKFLGFGFAGRLHQVRISKVPRYDKDFTPEKHFEPDKDTLALYHFDEGAGDVLKDSSGNGHHGKIVGAKWVKADGTAIPTPAPSNYALEFDGKWTHVNVPTLRYETDQPVTIEARVKFAPAQGVTETIASMYSPKSALLLCRSNGSSPVFLARRDLDARFAGLDGAIANDAWTHIAGVWDGKEARLFVDGKLIKKSVAKKLTPQLTAPQGQHLLLGADMVVTGAPMNGFFHGLIDELRISKTARYDKDFMPEHRFASDNNTVALYHCDEADGDVLKDSSGNGHHGKIVGAKWVKADGAAIGFPPLDPAWLKAVATMTADKQVEAVKAELMKRNPGFDGKLSAGIPGVEVTTLNFSTKNVTDISPVRALRELQSLAFAGGELFDLSPLKGMKLTSLNLSEMNVSDLSPLKDMKLTHLRCTNTNVSDLSPLKGMPLTSLEFMNTKVSDLSPLGDMKLTILGFSGTNVSDLSPLKGMKLTELSCSHTKVSDLLPLKDMPLTSFRCNGTQVSDLSPLKGMPLKSLECDFRAGRDAEILRSIKSLQTINGKAAAAFWKEVDKK